jgi:hypothetical protein
LLRKPLPPLLAVNSFLEKKRGFSIREAPFYLRVDEVPCFTL